MFKFDAMRNDANALIANFLTECGQRLATVARLTILKMPPGDGMSLTIFRKCIGR